MKELDPQEKKTPRSEMQPFHVLAFTLAVIALLTGILAVFPEDGLRITDDVVLYYPTWDDFFGEKEEVPDMREILAELEAAPDTHRPPVPTEPRDTLGSEAVIKKNLSKKIQYPGGDRSILFPAFAALERAAQGPGTVRVLHFGDSQIEGDRMTSLIRVRLQEKFGGSGPGMVAARPLVKSFSVRQEYSESMNRYALFAGRDTMIKHRRYGVMATMSRFSQPVVDSLINDEEESTGWFSLARAGGAYNKSKQYSTLRLFYGYNRRPFNVKVFTDDTPFAEDSFPTADRFRAARWSFASTPKKIMVIMNGVDSPDIFGVSLESATGVQVDNISMRGSSGTVFGGIGYGSFKPMLDSLNPKLVLLQYGGNTVPYIRSKKAAENYGKDFKRQIAFLKKQLPEAGFILIGPSDMAQKVKGQMQTFAFLEDVRDALKQAAFESGAGYFDIYEVMGGRNSMIQWVEGEEKLAGSDYVHFTPRGAKLIAQSFINSLLEDYEVYKQNRTQ
ncbi:MAG: GDSL-type esterase/lipase family protein [Bacteroidota bacterium]